MVRLALAWDRGKELTRHADPKITAGLDLYFCDPNSPWQRGTDENTNGLLRQYLTKGTGLSRWTPEDLPPPPRPQQQTAQDTQLDDTRRSPQRTTVSSTCRRFATTG